MFAALDNGDHDINGFNAALGATVSVDGVEKRRRDVARFTCTVFGTNWYAHVRDDSNYTTIDDLIADSTADLCVGQLSSRLSNDYFQNANSIDQQFFADDLVVCTHAVDAHGVQRAVIRLDDLSLAPAMRDRGVLIVDHSSAMVNLLEQAVRAPQSLGLVLHNDPNWEAVQITVTNPDAVGTEIRQLRLPQDVLVVAIVRSGQTIVPNGFTTLRRADELSLVGSPESLAEVTLQLGF